MALADVQIIHCSRCGMACKLADATVGIAVERSSCPLATYLAETHPGHHFEVLNTRIQIDSEYRVITPAWADRVLSKVDCNAQGTEIPASVFLTILDSVIEEQASAPESEGRNG